MKKKNDPSFFRFLYSNISQEFHCLTVTTPWIISADDKLMIFFLFFLENRIWHFMQIVSIGDNLQEIPKPVFWKKK